MADVEILRAARARIADPLHWTLMHFARDELGNSIFPGSEAAVCWCAMGAIRAETRSFVGPEADLLQRSAVKLFGFLSATHVNDRLGHRAVLEMYDDAIASAEAGL